MTLHDSDNDPDSGIVRGCLNYLTMILTCEAHRPPPNSDPQLSRSVAWTSGRRVSPSAKNTSIKTQSTHFEKILLTELRLSGSALVSDHCCLGCKGSNLWWIQPPMKSPRTGGGLWRMTLCCAMLLIFCFCYSAILSPVGQRADWLLSDEYSMSVMIHDTTQRLLIV